MLEWFGVLLIRSLALAEEAMPAMLRARCWTWLGCYSKALATLRSRDLLAKGFILRALAACGRQADAASLAHSIVSPLRRRSAAAAVAAFDPALAADFLKDASPSALQAAVLFAVGRRSAALATFRKLSGRCTKDPSVSLLAANCGALAPLDALNHCLSIHGLSSVCIDGPRFPGNLHGQSRADSADGPLVTIIVPAHNTENLVETSINSLLNQTWCNLEILAVDDASTDGTAERLHRLAERDARLKVLLHHRNAGPYAARMTALAHARGEFVTCHDSDDWAHPQRIEKQAVPLLHHRRLIATVSNWVRMTDAGEFYVRKSWPLIHHNPASVMFRKNAVIDRTGGFDLVRAGADSEFYERLKVVFGSVAIRRTEGILAVGSHRPGSLMNDPKIGVANHVLSPSRLAYWEAWRQWHVESLRGGKKPFMPTDGPRPFEAPSELLFA